VNAADLGSAAFRARYGVRLSYMAGAMAFGIGSEALVMAMSRAGLLASFGAAGLDIATVRDAIGRLRPVVPASRLCINLIHNPEQPAVERALADLLIREGIGLVEASAFMQPTEALVLYRAHGARIDPARGPVAAHRVIAKVSRREVASWFMRPPAREMLAGLVQQGALTGDEAAAASRLPIADDITIEADSAGHTDNQPLLCAFPVIRALRREVAASFPAAAAIGLGAAGGLGTPDALAAAFAMGVDYVVTGSINQACVESGTSAAVRRMLAAAESHDVAMAPAADMFEIGARVQVLKRGTMYSARAQMLQDLYRRVGDLDALAETDRRRVETQVFARPIAEVWQETQRFWRVRNPERLAEAERDAKLRMALVIGWYLGLSARWATGGVANRVMDYQIWCGPAMGAFNAWARETRFAAPEERSAPVIAQALMDEAAVMLSGLAAPPSEPLPLRDWLIAEVAAKLHIPPALVDPAGSFDAFEAEMGGRMAIMPSLEQRLGRRLSPTLLWNHPTIDSLAARLA